MTREEARVLLKTLNNQVTSAFYGGDFWVEEGTFEAFEVADAALRDMLKRREGCDFCNESEQIQNPYGDIMEMDDGVLILDTEGYPKVTFRIKYCPDCGRELSGNAEQVKEAGNEQAGSVRIP